MSSPPTRLPCVQTASYPAVLRRAPLAVLVGRSVVHGPLFEPKNRPQTARCVRLTNVGLRFYDVFIGAVKRTR